MKLRHCASTKRCRRSNDGGERSQGDARCAPPLYHLIVRRRHAAGARPGQVLRIQQTQGDWAGAGEIKQPKGPVAEARRENSATERQPGAAGELQVPKGIEAVKVRASRPIAARSGSASSANAVRFQKKPTFAPRPRRRSPAADARRLRSSAGKPAEHRGHPIAIAPRPIIRKLRRTPSRGTVANGSPRAASCRPRRRSRASDRTKADRPTRPRARRPEGRQKTAASRWCRY